MIKYLFVGAFLTTCSFFSQAQGVSKASDACRHSKITSFMQAKPSIASPAEEDYDVKYVKINLSLNNLSTQLSGNVTTAAVVVVPTTSQYVFELNSQLTIDSVKINGQVRPVSNAGDVRTVSLASPISQGANFTAQVFYRGQPLPIGPQDLGIRNDQSPSWGARATYTLSQPYGAKDWWPCKQALLDKIDSCDVWLTVPSNLKGGSNGLLVNTTALPGGLSRYEWKSRFAIDYYLISLSVAPYVDYSSYVHFPNSTDSMLMQNYIYDNPQTLPSWKSEIDSVNDMILLYSDLVGRYPFWTEKYGHCMAPLGGGMEHQTMTTQGTFETTLSAHELFHQWFGDHVTCATWKDIWLNEGFASYGEYLFVEKFWGANAAFQYMANSHGDVTQSVTGTLYVDDTTNVNRIFDGRLTYNKGSAVVHTLRFLVNDDTKFFNMLKNYQQQYAFSTATTEQFKNTASQFLQQNLDTFTNQWVYGQGFPIYSATWNQINDTVIVRLNQGVTAGASVSLFHSPIELKFTSPQGDTVVRVHNSSASQFYFFKWNKPMNNMGIDPNNWILNLNNGVTKDFTLTRNNEVLKDMVSIYPNPTTNAWTVSNLPAKSTLKLYDISGRMVYKAEVNSASAVIDAQRFSTGVYQLNIETADHNASMKLIKQ